MLFRPCVDPAKGRPLSPDPPMPRLRFRSMPLSANVSAAGTALLSTAKARTLLPCLRLSSLPLQTAMSAALPAAGTALLSAAKARTLLSSLRL